MPKPSNQKLRKIENYLVAHGFSGDIAINNGRKNALSIRRMVRGQKFYTFGIHAVEQAVRGRTLTAKQTQSILIEASGVDVKRFLHRGPGYFDPRKSTAALVSAMEQIKAASRGHHKIVFATGHPGAMTGFMTELAQWSTKLGGRLPTIAGALPTHSKLYLDMIGPVFVPSDNCSAFHSHETALINELLRHTTPNLVVADHGFVGGALNHGVPAVGFYDTDDPALPVAASLGLPLTAVPMNDNRYNADSAALARFLIEELG